MAIKKVTTGPGKGAKKPAPRLVKSYPSDSIKSQTLKGQVASTKRTSKDVAKEGSKVVKAEIASAKMQKGPARRKAMENAIVKYEKIGNAVDSMSSSESRSQRGVMVKPGAIKTKRK
jgi:hypothetical protein